MQPERSAHVSLGTWGLVGVELEKPVLTEDSRVANFTNELGVDGRIRYLRNVMGLWLLQEVAARLACRGPLRRRVRAACGRRPAAGRRFGTRRRRPPPAAAR